MKSILLAIFLFSGFTVFAQENFTIKAGAENTSADYLLLPFDPNYYLSDIDIDAEIGTHNKLKSLEIREFFREELDKKLFVTIRNKKKIQSMLMSGGNNTIKDLSYVLEGIKYEYVPLEIKKEDEKKTILKKPTGQLDKKKDTQAKYMRAACSDKKSYAEIFEKNNSNYIISINQFEIKNSFADQMNIQHNTHTRKISVHYNILDKNGKTIYGGIAQSEFANNVVDINEIVKLNFDKLATEITGHLPIN